MSFHPRARRPHATPALLIVAGLLMAGCAAPQPAESIRDPAPTTTPTPTTAPTPSTRPSTSSTPARISRAEASRSLLRATREGNLEAVRTAIDNGADLETHGRNRRTALLIATRANKIDIAEELLKAGADPDAKDAIEDSAFLYAGAEGLDEILRLTIEHGADVHSINRYGGTALIPAGEHAHLSTIAILIKAGVPVNHVNNLGWTALHETIVLGDGSTPHVRAARMLLEAGADPDLPDGHGVSPSRLAADRGFNDIVTVLNQYR